MKAKPEPKVNQGTFLYPDLIDQLNPKDPLLLLAAKNLGQSWKRSLLRFMLTRQTGKADPFDCWASSAETAGQPER